MTTFLPVPFLEPLVIMTFFKKWKTRRRKKYQKEEIYKLEIKISKKKKKDNSESQIKYDFSLQSGGLW